MFTRGFSHGFSAVQRTTTPLANTARRTGSHLRTSARNNFQVAFASPAPQTMLTTAQVQGASRQVMTAGMMVLGGAVGATIMSQTNTPVATPTQRLQQSFALRGSLLSQSPRQQLQANLALRASLAPPSNRARMASALTLRSELQTSQIRVAANRFFTM